MSIKKGFDWAAAKTRLERARLAIESTGYSSGQVDILYRLRAQSLAMPEAGSTEAAEHKIVVFRLGTARYGLPLEGVAEVIAKPRIAPAPGSPPDVVGLIQVRGEIRPVWNTARLLELAPLNSDETRNVLLLRNSAGEAGFLVSEVEDIRGIKDEDRMPPPEKAAHAAWMTNDLVVVLDPAAMFPGKTERNEDA
jgi:purine-binding chemotaxis protein CheW